MKLLLPFESNEFLTLCQLIFSRTNYFIGSDNFAHLSFMLLSLMMVFKKVLLVTLNYCFKVLPTLHTESILIWLIHKKLKLIRVRLFENFHFIHFESDDLIFIIILQWKFYLKELMLILGDLKIESVSVAKSNKFLFVIFDFTDNFGFLHSFQ